MSQLKKSEWICETLAREHNMDILELCGYPKSPSACPFCKDCGYRKKIVYLRKKKRR